jgi:hypothetical protein
VAVDARTSLGPCPSFCRNPIRVNALYSYWDEWIKRPPQGMACLKKPVAQIRPPANNVVIHLALVAFLLGTEYGCLLPEGRSLTCRTRKPQKSLTS